MVKYGAKKIRKFQKLTLYGDYLRDPLINYDEMSIFSSCRKNNNKHASTCNRGAMSSGK